jgi:hypothetical protein
VAPRTSDYATSALGTAGYDPFNLSATRR